MPDSGASSVWRRQPSNPAELSAHRRELAAVVHDGGHPDQADEGAVERLLLAFEELASNGLRHGQSPVGVTVSTTPSGWLLDVSDAAVDRLPAPAVDRDPSKGGLGLYLVARLSAARGWEIDGDRKHVWAHVPFSSDDEALSDPGRASTRSGVSSVDR